VFQDFKLVNGTWDIKNVDGKPERVKPADIKTSALLTVEGELDDISGSGQTKAAHDLCSGISKSKQQHFEAKGAGHYGIFSGRRWREQVYPQVHAFILAHHVAPKAAEKAPVKEAAKPVATPVAKPVEKTVTKTATKPAAKVVKAVAQPVVQQVVKPVAKPATKSVIKPAVKAASKPVVVQTPPSKVKTTWVATPKK
jgi:poly(3-hydroxybutyrate) depolymerase